VHVAKAAAFGVLLLTFIGFLVSPEHLLVLCVGGTLAAALLLLWPETDSPLLFMPFALQWLQVSLKPIETALTGQPLQDFAEFTEVLLPGAWLGIAGIAALGAGMAIGRGRSRFDWGLSLARDAAEVWPQGMVAQIALFLIIAGHVLAVVATMTGPARQILLAFADARHAGLFLLAYWCILRGRSLGLLAVVSVVEIAVGFTSFFADFRETVLILLFAAAAARSKLHFRGFLIMGLAAALTFGLAVFWSGIKHNYRDFLNQGTDTQTVDRSMSERLGYVADAADQFNSNQLQTGLRALAERESYIDILAATLEHVPTYVPHENGQLLGNSLLNIVKPRIFFPDKPETPDDSIVSTRYTGIRFDMAWNTSISIGYLGELYIDYGKTGAVIGAFCMGLLAGWMYKTMRAYGGIPLLFTYALISALMLQFAIFESDLVRLLGAVLTVFFACLVLQRMVAPQVLLALIARVPKVYS
jgi:lipid-A-disaccharide synthase-like uncharacterized protein